MKHSLLILLACSGSLSGAEPALTSKGPTTTEAPPAARATSPVTTQRLNAALPKFVARTPETNRASLPADTTEADTPRNAIIRLPQYDVLDDKLPEFREREILTPKGRVDLVLRRHPGLKLGPLAFLNVRRGLEMLTEEDELERRREMNELLSFRAAVQRSFPQDPSTGVRSIRVNASE